MSTTTTNYGLIKPDITDPILIGQLNDNADTIDATMKSISDALDVAKLGIKYKGEVYYYSDLPSTGNQIGDAYTVKYSGTSGTTPDGTEYVWGTVSGTNQWINFSKDSYTKAEVDALLALKQNALSSTQLDAVNSGIDSEKVEQIETNKNNISSLNTEIDTVANLGAKNLLDFDKWASNVPVYNGTKSYSNGVMTVTAAGSGCVTYHNQYFPEALKIPVKEGEKYTITWDTTVATNIGFFQLCPNGNAISGTDVSIADKQTEYTVASGVTYLTYRVGVWASGNSINISKLMLRPATISDSSYQPYAMSNAELTAAIQAIQAQLANQ